MISFLIKDMAIQIVTFYIDIDNESKILCPHLQILCNLIVVSGI
jgi:hypothetical protein